MKNKLSGFTPLEKAAGFIRRSLHCKAAGGIKPPSAYTVRECSSLTGFTVLEVIVVVIILGVLATLGLASFSAPKEQAMEKEAIGNLKLMASAEKIYRMENAAYINCANTAAVNTNLRLLFSSSDPNWRYKVVGASAAGFTAKAQRSSGPFAGTKLFCINQAQDVPQTTGCPAW